MNISKHKLYSFEEYIVGNKSRHTESIFFNIPDRPNELIKLYTCEDKDYLHDKKNDAENLMRFGKEFDIPEIITPTDILKVNFKFKGIIIPKLEGKNARVDLDSRKIPIKTKIQILKQIGTILEKISKLDNCNFAFADVHNDNFFVTKEKSQIKTYGLDADSMKMYDSRGRLNFYVSYNDNIKNFEKYGRFGNSTGEASYQTDLLCFIMMILELISDNEKIKSINLDDFYEYLDYLDKLGFNSDLLRCFANIYDDSIDNTTPLPYLDYLTILNEKATWDSFLKHKTLAIRPKL